MELLLPTLRADFAVYETYTYTAEEPLDCPILAFGGTQDTEVSRDELVAWRDQSRGPFRLKMFDGDHFLLHRARSILLAIICHELMGHPGLLSDGL
jgi:medium-chain acyl-[acyl-carrier-protein] hydrolase